LKGRLPFLSFAIVFSSFHHSMLPFYFRCVVERSLFSYLLHRRFSLYLSGRPSLFPFSTFLPSDFDNRIDAGRTRRVPNLPSFANLVLVLQYVAVSHELGQAAPHTSPLYLFSSARTPLFSGGFVSRLPFSSILVLLLFFMGEVDEFFCGASPPRITGASVFYWCFLFTVAPLAICKAFFNLSGLS